MYKHNVHLSSILYSRAIVREKGRGVKQLMAPGMRERRMAKSHLSFVVVPKAF